MVTMLVNFIIAHTERRINNEALDWTALISNNSFDNVSNLSFVSAS